MKVLALGLACLLLVGHAAHAARHGRLQAYQPHLGTDQRQLLDALLPGLAAAAAPASERGTSRGAAGGAGRGSSPSAVLLTALAYGTAVVACREWQPDTLEFDWPSNPTEYTAAGKTVPPSADVQKLTSLICSDPEAAGDQIRTDVDKGGAGAQAAVFSIFAADCDDEEAPADAFDTIKDAVTSGDPADIDAVSSVLTKFVEAADAVGIPICMSLAVIDTDTGSATDERFFHTTGPAPSGRSSRTAGGSGGSAGSGSAGSAGSGLTGTTGTGQGGSNP